VIYRVYASERELRLRDQLNPIWWFQTADNPQPPANYAGTKLQWLLRNFGHNARRYVIGVSHLPRICCGSMTETGNAFRQPSGILWGVTFAPWRPPLPYLSVRLRRPAAVYDLAVGWSVFGMAMLKARRMRPGAFDWE
jgi:hypothetical protein